MISLLSIVSFIGQYLGHINIEQLCVFFYVYLIL